DLVHRTEISTERRHPWWLILMAEDQVLDAEEYIKAHTKQVADIMTSNVITAEPGTPLQEIAEILEKYTIKRLPIVPHGRLVGIVSRANLVQAIATSGSNVDVPLSDTTIREKLLAELNKQNWGQGHTAHLNVTVNGGVVDLWGFIESNTER